MSSTALLHERFIRENPQNPPAHLSIDTIIGYYENEMVPLTTQILYSSLRRKRQAVVYKKCNGFRVIIDDVPGLPMGYEIHFHTGTELVEWLIHSGIIQKV